MRAKLARVGVMLICVAFGLVELVALQRARLRIR